MNKERVLTLSLIILAAALSRLIPHPYNFTPVAAIALFAGAQFERKWQAFAVPTLAVLLGDCILGFYTGMWVTYLGFAAVVCVGFGLRGRQQFLPVVAGTLVSAVLFFLITNFGPLVYDPVLHTPSYPATLDGIMQGYVMGIPFFQNTLLSDMFYSALLFGSFALAQRKFTGLHSSALTAQ